MTKLITDHINEEIGNSMIQPDDDYNICPRCNCCEMYWQECWSCGGEGGRDGDELMSEDPLWYSPDDFETCDECEGKGGFWICDCDENGKHEIKSKQL